jgi:prophage antirepressor-like protein
MNEVKLLDSNEIRAVFYKGEWYFAVNDVVTVIAESSNPGQYIKSLAKEILS